jgi:hypothetical protein
VTDILNANRRAKMVHVECIVQPYGCPRYTNAKWPTEIAARPLKGDSVESEDGNYTLQVLNVTHAIIIVPDKESCQNGRKEVPGLKVYLGL